MSETFDELATGPTPGGPADPTTRQRRNVRAPSMPLMLAEQRALFEIGALGAAAPWLRAVGRGDRHPVLVLPGFMGGDTSTVALRFFVRSWGYWSHGWGLGQNLGPTREVLHGIDDRLEALHSRHGRKVSLVGWSLGGIYARYLARRHPEWVRQVITLGSPIQMREGDRAAPSQLTDLLKARFDPEFPMGEDHLNGPLPVPSTTIYSRTDGVVRWQVCLDVVDDLHENVEVESSHVGFGFHPAALYAVGDRLRQPEGTWKAFEPPCLLRRMYPSPGQLPPRGPPRPAPHDGPPGSTVVRGAASTPGAGAAWL
ncbi:MAG: alpha/beta hydrolase [Ilumatobacteraceae bacterium]